MLKFFQAPNLKVKELTEGEPWKFSPDSVTLETWRGLDKPVRRNSMTRESTEWNVYSPVGGAALNLRVSNENPPVVVRGIVGDYDKKMEIAEVVKQLKQHPPQYWPNWLEKTLSGNIRLIWVFEREALMPNSKFCALALETFIEELRAEHLLPGFDSHSITPAEVWTNGGEWHCVNEKPLPWEIIFGILCKVSKKAFENKTPEIPLPIVAEEVEKRWPGRWKGPFELETQGVRFWDPQADCPTGCQVKPDGILCFTGRIPFLTWDKLFGAAWAGDKRSQKLGESAKGIYFDGRAYWEQQGRFWRTLKREDVLLTLRNRNISTKTARGQTATEADRVLHYIQTINRVDGAGPMPNYAPGLVEIEDKRLLNTSALRPLLPSEKTNVTTEDFPWLWKFLNGLFDHPELKPLDYFFAWLRRAYDAALNHKKLFGQAVFLCGPAGNGKTLLCFQVLKPMLGHKCANPYEYFTGATSFNSDLFQSFLLAINDEEATTRDEVRSKFLARLKAWVVNPQHEYHPKFCDKISIEWVGRIFSSLNDDETSAGLLPEVNENTSDKMMFFGSRAFADQWPDRDIIEATIARELPFFARWLLNWTPPAEVVEAGRMGVKSFYDPKLRQKSVQNGAPYMLYELLGEWIKNSPHWSDGVTEWIGTASKLVLEFSIVETNNPLAREWTAYRTGRALVALSRDATSGVHIVLGGRRRNFRLVKAEIEELREKLAPVAATAKTISQVGAPLPSL